MAKNCFYETNPKIPPGAPENADPTKKTNPIGPNADREKRSMSVGNHSQPAISELRPVSGQAPRRSRSWAIAATSGPSPIRNRLALPMSPLTAKLAEHAEGLRWSESREAHLVKGEAAELSVTGSQWSLGRRFSAFILLPSSLPCHPSAFGRFDVSAACITQVLSASGGDRSAATYNAILGESKPHRCNP